jgi:hypothetical protein
VAVASPCAHSIAICEAPISVEWMLHVTSTNAFPSFTSASPSAAESPRGSESFCEMILSRFKLFMFASDEMTAMNMSSPSVVLPRLTTCTRGDCLSSSLK